MKRTRNLWPRRDCPPYIRVISVVGRLVKSSALPSMLLGVEMCFLTIPWAASTQPGLVLN